MYSLALLAISSFVISLFFTPIFRAAVVRHSGGENRSPGGPQRHVTPVPRTGGVPIAAAYLGAFALLLILPLSAGGIVAGKLPLALKILPAATLVFAIGLVDDLRALNPWQKLAGQTVAAYIAYWGGVQLGSVAGVALPPWLGLPLTLLWLVGCSNAFNLIDGVDGLAAGAGLFATVTILLGALLHNNVMLALATAPLAGALLGFLRYNFNPASIFLGDSGSLTIGFLLGCYGLLWGQESTTVLGMTAPLMALAVPLMDTAITIGRRFLRQKPIFAADLEHIHHRLLERGLTPRRVALLLYAACGIAATMSLVASVSADQYKGAIIVLFCAAAWIGVQHLGYVEFGTASRMFIDGAFRRHLSNELALRSLEDALRNSETPEACWSVIRDACRNFGFARAELTLNGHYFTENLVEVKDNPTWNIVIPLPEMGRLLLTRCFGAAHPPTVLVPFAEALHRNLCINGAKYAQVSTLVQFPVSESNRRSKAANTTTGA